MTTDPAVQAAAEALTLIPGTTVAYPQSVAATVVAAARPIIEAEIRERIAAKIEALPLPSPGISADYDLGFVFTKHRAARIARGQKEKS